MGDAQAVASNVAMAIAAAFDWTSTPDARNAAVSYLDSIKTGDVRVLASASFLLVKKDWSTEIRLHAIKLLQHLVRLRWGELSPSEHRDFANAAVEMMTETAYSCEQWALKSQISALVAEIVRREGLTLWQELLPSLVSFSSKGPIQAELISLTLRWLPEDIIVHNEDLEGDRRRLLLRGLTESLPDILPLLYSLLDRHFSNAMHEAEKKQYEIAKQHAATVTATLSAVAAYAEWAPLPDLAKFGIIYGSGVLLSSPDFRLHASEFFKLVSSRKQPVDADAEFDSAMGNVFHIIMSVSRDFLYKSTTVGGQMDESDFEFAEYICEIMVSLGCSNLQCISGESTVLSLYLEQMLGFFLHHKLALHFQSLLFWSYLLRDLLSKSKTPVDLSRDSTAGSIPASSSGQIPKEKKTILEYINDDICGKMLETSFQRLLKKEKVSSGTLVSLGNFELWSDDFEGRGDFGQYRQRMLELIKLVATYKPLTSGRKVAERVHSIINNPIQDIALMESMHLALEYVVIAIFEGLEFIGGNSEVQHSLCAIFEGLLKQVLSLKLTDPVLVELLGRYLDAFGPFLKCFPNAIGSVINKLFELLTSLPITVKDPSTSSARHARLHICSSFVRIAKAVDRSILPHMKAIADTMAYLQREGRILRGEHNILGEAFLVMASSAGLQQQQEVLAWLLEPLIQQWVQTEWQNKYLSEPSGLVHLCAETSFMWSIFHTVTFFEKALKRSGYRKSNVNLQNSPSGNVAPLHPMASHLSWMLPPLIKVFRWVLSKLLRVIHSLLSGPVFCMLPGEIKAALTMSYAEKTTLLGEGISKSVKGTPSFMDGSQTDLSKQGSLEPNENDVRNWLKGVRDSGYNVLGLSMTIGDTFFKCLDAHSVAVSLMENIQSMEFRHIRQLVHLVVVPLVKHCPLDSWGVWLENILQPLLIHSQQTLSISWSSLLHEGRAKVPDTTGMDDSSDLKVEVMEEKLLRDLTREICALLSVMASPPLNTGLPSLEQSGQASRVDVSSVKEVGTFAETSMVSFLIKHKGLAVPALQMSLEAFTWTDGEAMAKVCAFCATVTQVAIFTNNVELQQYVSRDLFSAIIHGLTLESNAVISADLVSLCREIYVYLCDRDPAPRQVLMSLPSVTPHDLIAFKEALTKTSSPKEQKLLMKSLLLSAAGNNLKALAAQKSINVITNMSARPRSSVSAPSSRVEEDDTVGLASIL